MAEPSTHINYSFEDIQRYLQGKMSAAEMHAIEKAALQDPFLADALEGFHDADLTTAQQHLNEINASLIKEKKESKVVAFNKRTQWLNIAALVIVLAGIGVLATYFLGSFNQQTKVAQVKKEEVRNNALNDSSVQKLSTPMVQQDSTLYITQNKNTLLQRSAAKKSISKKVITADENKQEDKSNITAMANSPAAVQQNEDVMTSPGYASTPDEKKDSVQHTFQAKAGALNILPNTFSGKVADQNGDPVPFATITINSKKKAIAADAEGNFSMQDKDTALLVTTSAIGCNSKNVLIKQHEQNIITLTRLPGNISDAVVTTALGTEKKSKALPDSTMPVGGWKNFNKYVTEQLNKDTTAESVTDPDDAVEVEFLIDKMGNPYDFKVVKPLDDQRNAKAIEILKNGPKWTNTSKKKKAHVKINF